jgi:hypothetical protein
MQQTTLVLGLAVDSIGPNFHKHFLAMALEQIDIQSSRLVLS